MKINRLTTAAIADQKLPYLIVDAVSAVTLDNQRTSLESVKDWIDAHARGRRIVIYAPASEYEPPTSLEPS